MLKILFPGIKEGQYTLLIILSCISVALWLLIAIARWSMFTKMGEKGWKAFIPFYDIYILFSKCWSTRAAWNYITGIFVSVLFEFGVFKSTGDIAMIASYIYCQGQRAGKGDSKQLHSRSVRKSRQPQGPF